MRAKELNGKIAAMVDKIYEETGFPRNDGSRKTEYVVCRHAIMYWLRRKFPKESNHGISSAFGMKDHCCVTYSMKVFSNMLDTSQFQSRLMLEKIDNVFQEGAATA